MLGPGDDLLSHGQSAISSARRRFTALFGMGRGGANALWSPGILKCASGVLGLAHEWGWKVKLQMGFALHRVRAVEAWLEHLMRKVIESSRTGN